MANDETYCPNDCDCKSIKDCKLKRTRLETIQDTIDLCAGIQGEDWLCMHCEEKRDLISIACGWAFDEGAKLV